MEYDISKCFSAEQCEGCTERNNCTNPLIEKCKDAVETNVSMNVDFTVSKSKDELGLVSGWANVSVNANGSIPMDWQDDVIPTSVLEKAAINFMKDFRGSGVEHKGAVQGTIVESIVFTKDKQAAIGIPEGTVPEGWFITVQITDQELFKAVKNGKYRMFSIQGKAKKIKL
jgi:hypothetical protein